MTHPSTAIIGPGAAGQALAQRLIDSGFFVQAFIGRNLARTKVAAERLGVPYATDFVGDLPTGIRLVLCCVPDDALPDVAEDLAAITGHPWSETAVAHVSGAVPASVLDPVAQRGALTFGFHPVQSFGRNRLAVFDGVVAGIEGTERAAAYGQALALHLGLKAVVIPAEAKARYHLAASVASNFSVTVASLATEILHSIGLDPEAGMELLRPLLAGTFANLAEARPEDALTGPIVRGDRETVARHAEAVRHHLPHLAPALAALMNETVRVAVRAGRLDLHDADALLGIVESMVERGKSG
ncbi:MAG: Rossmann-like and DUF2520 domain-containing protein [Bacteroidota bacterium]